MLSWSPEDRTDPVREYFLSRGASPDLESVRSLFPPLTGDPAFDPDLIRRNVSVLKTVPEVRTGHPLLDLSVKIGLASIDATFEGDHPKYGVKGYSEECHDGFPPTIIAAVDALSAWGLAGRAARLYRYWLTHFVKRDGSIAYRGTSLAELGQLLHTAALLEERIGPDGWWDAGNPALSRIVERLLGLRREAQRNGGLLTGVPEDDEREKPGRYFHNNAWTARGLERWAGLCERRAIRPALSEAARRTGKGIRESTLKAIGLRWPKDEEDWWLPPKIEPLERPASLTSTRDASYTNYRYWPELLSSGLLPSGMANRIVDARVTAGGQFCGMTRFSGWLDDWPLADYLRTLWMLGRRDDYLLSLYGHAAYHQAEGHLTAYEQVTLPPGREKAAYCLPCQLVAARAARLLLNDRRPNERRHI